MPAGRGAAADRYKGVASGYMQLRVPMAAGEELLQISYAGAGFDGCPDTEDAVATTVLGRPALYMDSHGLIQLIWPATVDEPSGDYGLYGGFPIETMLRWAEEIEAQRAEVVATSWDYGC